MSKKKNQPKLAPAQPRKPIPQSRKLEKKIGLVAFATDQMAGFDWKKAFWAAAAVILMLTIALSFRAGVNADDSYQNLYSDNLVKWYATFGRDTSAINNPQTPLQHHYGGFFEVITGATNSVLGFDNMDPGYHHVRHFWNAIFGVLAMIFAGLFAKQIGGWRVGVFALLFIFLTPAFLGHSLINPKDIPFATGYVISLYGLARLLRELPKPYWQTLAALAAGIAIAIGTRTGGFLLIAYLGLFVGLEFLLSYGFGAIFSQWKLVSRYLLYSLVAVAIGLLVGLIFWPYALTDPFKHIPESFKVMAQFGVNIRILFNGGFIFSQDIPWNYTMIWMLFTLPLFALLGLVLFLVFSKGIFRRYPKLLLSLAVFAFVFPIFYVIYKKSPMYDGWRHMIFPYTAAVALIALGWDYLLSKFSERKTLVYALAGVLALTALEPAWFIARNSAHPYVYFNPLKGGVKGAFGDFETDYWGISARQAGEWLESQGILKPGMEKTVIIASDFNYNLERFFKKKYGDKVSIRYTKYRTRNDIDWDYGIFCSRYISGDHLKHGTWPPVRAIHTIKASGVPIVAILKDEDKFAFKAQQAMKTNNFGDAIPLFEQELTKDSLNELAAIGIANAYLSVNDAANAKPAIERYNRIVPNSYITQNLWGSYYLALNDQNNAIVSFKKSVELQPDNATGFYYLGLLYSNQNKLSDALEMAKKAVEAAPQFRPAYDLAAQIYEKSDDPGMAKAYRDAAQKIK
jgi:tetratricopeptide (TPR) repeat protein